MIDMLDFLLEHDDKHLINFSELLPNGKSFFTTLSPSASNLKDVIIYLLNHGADPNFPDKFGEYPFQYAIDTLNIQFAEILLYSKEIDLSQRIHFSEKYDDYVSTDVTSTYLHFAAKKNNEIITNILKTNEIDINVTDSRGETPLFTAARNKSAKTIDFLFDNDNLDHFHRNNQGKTAYNIMKIDIVTSPIKAKDECKRCLIKLCD